LKEKAKNKTTNIWNDKVEENFIISQGPQRRVAEKNMNKLKEYGKQITYKSTRAVAKFHLLFNNILELNKRRGKFIVIRDNIKTKPNVQQWTRQN
jgi:hypothetical protein